MTLRPNMDKNERLAPIVQTNVTGTTTGTAQTIFTVPPEQEAEVATFSVTNTTALAATLSIHIVPSGGTIGATNLVISALSVAMNDTVSLKDELAGLWDAGDTIQVFSGTPAALSVRGSMTVRR